MKVVEPDAGGGPITGRAADRPDSHRATFSIDQGSATTPGVDRSVVLNQGEPLPSSDGTNNAPRHARIKPLRTPDRHHLFARIHGRKGN
jgi:hypothetical protein